MSPLQGDVHGCPYKTLDKESLRAALLRLRVAPAAAEEAVAKAKVRVCGILRLVLLVLSAPVLPCPQ